MKRPAKLLPALLLCTLAHAEDPPDAELLEFLAEFDNDGEWIDYRILTNDQDRQIQQEPTAQAEQDDDSSNP